LIHIGSLGRSDKRRIHAASRDSIRSGEGIPPQGGLEQ
jgi:hypothetical protein